MQQVIYVDVLIVLNILITYLLLLATSHILRNEPSAVRMLAGSFLGGVYSLIILAPPFGLLLSVLVKLLLSLSIVTACFKPRSLSALWRSLVTFFLVNFAFAGLMFGVWELFQPNGMKFLNGSVYFNFSFVSLMVTAVVCYFTVSVFNRVTKRQAPENRVYAISIGIFGKEVAGQGFLDTGNSLTDGFLGVPVIVAKKSFVEALLPGELDAYFDGDFTLPPKNIPKAWSARIRVVPAVTPGASTLLPSFRPEYVRVGQDRLFRQVLVAVCPDHKLHTDYACLLNMELLEEFSGDKGEKAAVSGVGRA